MILNVSPTRWQTIEKRANKTEKFLKKCLVAERHVKLGFKNPVVNVQGKCEGCRNPDDEQLEERCRICSYNEYYIEEATGQY